MTSRFVAVLAAVAVVLGPASPAQASREPIKNTTYAGSATSGDTTVSVSVRIGDTKTKVKKFTFDVSCPEGAVRKTVKNLEIKESSFGKDVGGEGFAADYNIRGVWFTKHKLNVVLYVNKGPCQTQVDFYVKG